MPLFEEDAHLCELYEVLDYTIAGLKASRHTHLHIFCRRCKNSAEPNIAELNWPDHWHLGDLARRFVCQAALPEAQGGGRCGARFPRIEAYRFSPYGPGLSFSTWGGGSASYRGAVRAPDYQLVKGRKR